MYSCTINGEATALQEERAVQLLSQIAAQLPGIVTVWFSGERTGHVDIAAVVRPSKETP